MDKYTKKMHEEHLNNWYADYYDGRFDKLYEDFSYCMGRRGLWKAYQNREIGTVLRNYDYETFNKTYQSKLKAHG
jgi:hypothetical protein